MARFDRRELLSLVGALGGTAVAPTAAGRRPAGRRGTGRGDDGRTDRGAGTPGPKDPEPLWQNAYDADARLATGESVVVAVVDGDMYGLDQASGERVWTTTDATSARHRNAVVYVEDGVGFLHGTWGVHVFDPSDGTVRFTVDTDSMPASTERGDGLVAVSDIEGNWYVHEETSGERVNRGAADGRRVHVAGFRDRTLFLNDDRSGVRAVDVDDGTVHWTAADRAYEFGWLGEGALYAGTRTDTAVALDAATGQERWSFTVDDPDADVTFVLPTDAGRFVATPGQVYELDPETHEQRWVYDGGRGIPWFVHLDDERLVVRTRGELHAVDRADGSERWTFRPDAYHLRCVHTGGVFYVVSGGQLTTLSLDGESLATRSVAGPSDPNSLPAVAAASDAVAVANGSHLSGWPVNDVPSPTVSLDGTPRPGEPVTLEASVDDEADPSELEYEWVLDDDVTATGRSVEHTYEETGNYTVELTVTDPFGVAGTTTRAFEVSERTPTATPSPTSGPGDSAAPVPGFGLGVAGLALGAVGAWLRRRTE
jgi:outer membrane protein assembly factor BamB